MIKHLYQPALDAFVRHPVAAVVMALALVGASVPVALNLGGEFMPRLNEGDLLIEAVRIPSASLEGAVAASTQVENLLKTIPEVRLVYCKTGRPEIANDVMGVHQTDVWTMLKPQDEWRPGLTRDALIEEMDKLLSEHVPGMKFGFSQPIEMRVNELVAGVKSDVAALIYGPDLKVLRRLSLEIERVLGQIPGAHDIKNPTAGRLPMLRIKVRRDQLARYGIKASDVLDSVAALGGTTVGTVFEEDKRHPLRVRLPESWRNDPDKIGSIRVVDPQGRPIPLKDLAEIAEEEGPNEVERENVQHRAVVGVNVRGRDICQFRGRGPGRDRRPLQEQVPPGYRVRWGGQFEHLQTASKRLMIVVPVAMLLIFLLLYGTFHSIRLSLLIYTAVPMAATGGVFALFLRGLPFSISAGVGFIALFGVAVLNGLVWVSAVEHLRQEGVEPHEAAREAAVVRLRPILMTALVAGLGFIPMAIATTPGAEIQRPLATVVIGGLITSTLLTTLVLPAVYPWFVQKPQASRNENGKCSAELGRLTHILRVVRASVRALRGVESEEGSFRSRTSPVRRRRCWSTIPGPNGSRSSRAKWTRPARTNWRRKLPGSWSDQRSRALSARSFERTRDLDLHDSPNRVRSDRSGSAGLPVTARAAGKSPAPGSGNRG